MRQIAIALAACLLLVSGASADTASRTSPPAEACHVQVAALMDAALDEAQQQCHRPAPGELEAIRMRLHQG